MSNEAAPKTAWGVWIESQPKGVLTRAQEKTGLSWSTVCRAMTRRVNRLTAKELSKFTKGEVPVKDIARN